MKHMLRKFLGLTTICLCACTSKTSQQTNNDAAASLNPTAIYKIVRPADFNKTNADNCILLSQLDIDTHFIHASFGRQVESILNKFFKDADKVLALELIPSVLEANGTIVKEEANKPGGEHFVHLYGTQKIPLAAVSKIFTCKKQADGTWILGNMEAV